MTVRNLTVTDIRQQRDRVAHRQGWCDPGRALSIWQDLLIGSLHVRHPMAKSITALAVGIALGEGKIRSLDDRAEVYAPGLRGTLYGGTALRDLLRMASGARDIQTGMIFTGDTRFAFPMKSRSAGIESAAHLITDRATEEGSHFSYASSETAVVGAVLRGATGGSVSAYLTPRLWQAIGAETSALWRTERTGLEVTLANFNATLRATAKARPDGDCPCLPQGAGEGTRRADDVRGSSRDFLLTQTDCKRVPQAFRPGRSRSTLLAVMRYFFGCSVARKGGSRWWGFMANRFEAEIPPEKLWSRSRQVPIGRHHGERRYQLLNRERDAFWRGIVSHYGSKWQACVTTRQARPELLPMRVAWRR